MRGIKHSLISFKEKYYEKFPDSKIEILEILPKEKVRCKDKYSEYITRFASLFNDYLPTFTLSLNKKQHFANKAKEVHGDKYDYSLVELNKMTDKVKIICKKHGEFFQRGTSHLFGQGCYKCKNINHILKTSSNTDEFIKKANLKHNFKYDYSLVKYINSKTVLKIICPIHGKFEQIANNHLNGKNCSKCARKSISKYNSENPSSWNYINWEKAGNNSKNFDSFKLYIIQCYDENEKFYKIGKTYRKVEKRFNSLIKMPYKYKIINIIEGDSREISILEKELQKLHKEYKYIPNVIFKGNNECFINLKQKEIKKNNFKYIKTMTNIEKLKTFIKDNNLEFNSGSGGDVNILALCGYACYIEATEHDCINSIGKEDISINLEINKVFNYANTHNYAKWWNTETAKKQWKF